MVGIFHSIYLVSLAKVTFGGYEDISTFDAPASYQAASTEIRI
jgi:hypothetical protein